MTTKLPEDHGNPNAWEPLALVSSEGLGLAPERRKDGMPTSADERKLRRMYAVRVGMPNLYMDDGEASGSEHGIQIDFMREPVADIAAKVLALEVARYECRKTPNVRAKPGATVLRCDSA